MIVIPPRDPNENNPPDPAAEALGKLYEQFTNVQNLGEFHAALRRRDALYELQHEEIGDNPQDFENLHPRDFYRQFDRRADNDDKTVVIGSALPHPRATTGRTRTGARHGAKARLGDLQEALH